MVWLSNISNILVVRCPRDGHKRFFFSLPGVCSRSEPHAQEAVKIKRSLINSVLECSCRSVWDEPAFYLASLRAARSSCVSNCVNHTLTYLRKLSIQARVRFPRVQGGSGSKKGVYKVWGGGGFTGLFCSTPFFLIDPFECVRTCSVTQKVHRVHPRTLCSRKPGTAPTRLLTEELRACF